MRRVSHGGVGRGIGLVEDGVGLGGFGFGWTSYNEKTVRTSRSSQNES